MKLLNWSISAKLYAIFALLASLTAALPILSVVKARQHAALSNELEAAFHGAQNVERVNGLIHAVVMESRGISLAADSGEAHRVATSLSKYNQHLSEVMEAWGRDLRGEEASQFSDFAGRVRIFQDFRRELARRAKEINVEAARAWSELDDGGSVHALLSSNLAALAKVYADRADRIYAKVELGTTGTAWLMAVLGMIAIGLAALGAFLIHRAVARPLARITAVTQAVARGDTTVAVPHQKRRDEIGALAQSIAVFQNALRRNDELNEVVRSDAETRARHQQRVAEEIEKFGADMEATLSELSTISTQMVGASSELSSTANDAASRMSRAAGSSGDASARVREIAAAAGELSLSISEIDRQVVLSADIATKAVGEAARTTAAVKELDEAAARIGDVVRLITAIAEQTNLLALNATIEAARAGEAGRGFAVVANEVKALASQTAKATEEIGGQIGGMQEAMQRSIEAIKAIEGTIREVGNISTKIAAAVTEQGAATEGIARSAEAASRRTSETAQEVAQVGEATTVTHASAEAVKSVADNVSAVTERVRAEIGQFFTRLRVA